MAKTSKIQKIWLWIFGAMFLISEILWGSIIKGLRIPFLPILSNAQYFSDNPSVAFLIIIVEVLGISGFIYLFNRRGGISKTIKLLANILLSIILVVLLLSLYFSFVMTRVSFF